MTEDDLLAIKFIVWFRCNARKLAKKYKGKCLAIEPGTFRVIKVSESRIDAFGADSPVLPRGTFLWDTSIPHFGEITRYRATALSARFVRWSTK